MTPSDHGASRRATYLRRRGRITQAQRRSLEIHQNKLVIVREDTFPNWSEVFSRSAPLGAEIGFGMGHALVDWASREREMNLVGVDVYQPGVGGLLLAAEEQGLDNLRVITESAQWAFQWGFAPVSLSEVRVFFPDPWPKKRHHKRRLIQPDFTSLLASRLAAGGRLLLATDWEPYARWMLEVLEADPALENAAGSGFAERTRERPVTRFEARGARLGHGVWDLVFVKR